MASVLFIAPEDLGETVLATGALEAVLTPGDTVSVVCAREAAVLFRALPGLTRVRISEGGALEQAGKLWLELAGTAFDTLIDARETMLGRLVRARRRIAPQRSKMLRHRVEEWSEWIGAERTPAPKLWLDDAARAAAQAAAPGAGPLLALAPGGMPAGKRWPAERFAAAARRLASGPLAGARVALLGVGARDGALTQAIAASLEADGVAAADLSGTLDLLGAAALAERATLCVGNDNVLTHSAAALGAPTLSLFGPTDERVRAPYGARTRTLRGRPFEAIMAAPVADGRSLLDDLSVDAVEAAAVELLHAGGL